MVDLAPEFDPRNYGYAAQWFDQSDRAVGIDTIDQEFMSREPEK